MNDQQPTEINRRDLLKNAAAVTLAGAVTSAGPGADSVAQDAATERTAPAAASDPTLIRRENKKQGSRDWQLTRVRLDKRGGLRCPPVEGYCSKQSVSAGESIDIMVSTDPAQKFSIEIFRTGYYGGRGARLMTTLGPFNGGGDWVCAKPDHWIFEGTGMKKGEAIPGLIGWEYHGDPQTDIPGLEIVAEGTALQGGVNPQQWTSTIYPGPKGNFVFNASTIWWCQDLATPPGHWLPWSHWSHWSRPHALTAPTTESNRSPTTCCDERSENSQSQDFRTDEPDNRKKELRVTLAPVGAKYSVEPNTSSFS